VARYCGSVCKLCRREKEKLYLKGSRCYTEKCAVQRREYPPGQHGLIRSRPSEYATQLREKQKIKRIYGLQERQFRNTFMKAESQAGITGENLILALESRLDNVVYRMGFSESRRQSRMFVRQEHFMLNGKKATLPSQRVRLNDVIEIKVSSRQMPAILSALDRRRPIPDWLEVDRANFKGIVRLPLTRDQVTEEFNEQLAVNLYSR